MPPSSSYIQKYGKKLPVLYDSKRNIYDFLTVQEASDLVRMTPSRLRGHAYSGRLPFYSVGKQMVFTKQDIYKFKKWYLENNYKQVGERRERTY